MVPPRAQVPRARRQPHLHEHGDVHSAQHHRQRSRGRWGVFGKQSLNIAAGAWYLPQHESSEPEDNLISMSLVMFTALSTIANVVAGAGAYLRRPGYLQLSIVFNSVFILCIFLIAVVTCLFSPELKKSQFLDSAGNITLVVILFFAGAAYSLYYLTVVNTLYRTMKDDGDSAIPI
ncbi:hypothetical protein ABMA27_003781 [Loxostege sticticalis]|uniref:MARVEL domain-containing protein n=1 Tax=Loxostege sticticalis TaxID=481309 RepID=A0ABR3HQA0_LOXSC